MFVTTKEQRTRVGLLTRRSAFALISLAFSSRTPNYRAFSVVDLSISYPMQDETISTSSLILAAVVGPAVIILLVCLVLVPTIRADSFTRPRALQLKLWEWNTGWMGLALSLATSTLVVAGMKNVFGRPRPDMLSRCVPNLANIAAHTVGGYHISGSSDNWVLVNQTLCQQTDLSILNDGFRSFPSGHAASKVSEHYGEMRLTLSSFLVRSSLFNIVPRL